MAINVNVANVRAAQLLAYADQLRTAKHQLSSYKMSVASHWQGPEVTYITQGVDQTIAQLDSVINQLHSLSSDIKSAASAIKREDDAAAAAARARVLKQQRIQTAQTNYNRAVDECDNLYKERDALQKELMKNMSASKRNSYMKKWDELLQKIQEAERNRSNCYNTLAAARR